MNMVQLSEARCYEELSRRLDYLEKWREIAERPVSALPEDFDLLCQQDDDLEELNRRCLRVRSLANSCLPIDAGPFDCYLEARTSKIPTAGKGLFTTRSFEAGDVICYYFGHIHNYHSAKHLVDRDYLMLVQGDVLVDPGPIPEIKARYINDPLNDAVVNVRFVPEITRSAVVALRDIARGEELYVEYGQGYWAQQAVPGRSYIPTG